MTLSILKADFFLYNSLHASARNMNWDTQLWIAGLDLDTDLTRTANIYEGTEHVDNIIPKLNTHKHVNTLNLLSYRSFVHIMQSH